ncbi:MAG: hypothetical protein JWP38_1196 [Herbaspirillum sp.]|nr:hypothetical protein [Herbaspirillum sp.]
MLAVQKVRLRFSSPTLDRSLRSKPIDGMVGRHENTARPNLGDCDAHRTKVRLRFSSPTLDRSLRSKPIDGMVGRHEKTDVKKARI